MATASQQSNQPAGRRTASTSSPVVPNPLPRVASARSAASPRPSPHNVPNVRRPLSKNISSPPIINEDIQDEFATSLKMETAQKEQLLVQLQDKDQLLATYSTENAELTSALSSTESRLRDLYAEQSRWETELSQRIDISDKLRDQLRELEKEKRDIQRRYNEQTATFEAERQALYDNEQHLKSRIQSLTQSRIRTEPSNHHVADVSDVESDNEPSPSLGIDDAMKSTQQQNVDDDNEPAEMTSLKLELSTLSTSYASLQSTLILMQTQLVDLKRVNQELQEENESYMILLREKTLSGQFDVMRQVGGTRGSDEDNSDNDGHASTDVSSMRSFGRSTLDIVEEESIDNAIENGFSDDISESKMSSSLPISRSQSSSDKHRRSTYASRGESLAGLPITGPGLDLAAELGRAENKDLFAADPVDDHFRTSSVKNKRNKKTQDSSGLPPSESAGTDFSTDIDALRTEVKSLKDANKALSLYASKIIDRIIAQEGFEHVLAADYEKEPSTPSTAVPRTASSKPTPTATKARPQSVSYASGHQSPKLGGKLNPANATKADAKSKRRSLSFDWSSFSFASTEKKPEPNLRPLTLTPGSMSVTGARKLDTTEDEEDRKERERLHATMKLMGIQPPAQSPLNSPAPPAPPALTPAAKSNRRFSLFGSKTVEPDTTSIHSANSSSIQYTHSPADLTTEALEHVEAENSLAALDARERDLSVEISKGSSGGFTEIAPRVSRRGRKSNGGSSASTVWSAGMSGNDE
ncbi:hypothetical protein D9619_003255 [Psilocybe cf. subviscida]|uniref:Uncharacterized protein n=1 Tax=Psilocybe cf. subviscida TaxID=2480587 RepID=A0A8H5AXV4_9AGAR|nr:hypothetical protein D9619_003255 [Psilocybe cf. subviscida]